MWICFIADGIHIPFFALRNYLRVAGVGRCLVVSDAMAAAGLGPGRHTIGRWDVEVGDDLAAWAPGNSHLLGSAMSMARAATNLQRELGLSKPDIATLTRINPRRAILLPTSVPLSSGASSTTSVS